MENLQNLFTKEELEESYRFEKFVDSSSQSSEVEYNEEMEIEQNLSKSPTFNKH